MNSFGNWTGQDLFFETDSFNVPSSFLDGEFAQYYYSGGYGPEVGTPSFYQKPTEQQVQDWTQDAVDAGVQVAGNWFQNLLGWKPRGDFAKYLREVAPTVKAKAMASKLPVDVYWFDDVVRMNPSGKWGVTYNANSLASADAFWAKLATTDHFLVLRCPSGSEDIPRGTCEFDEHGSGSGLLGMSLGGNGGGSVGGGMSSAGLGWLSLVALAFLIWKGGFKL